MKRRLFPFLVLVLLVAACGPTRLTLPTPPAAGWQTYEEPEAGGITVRLPASWRAVDLRHRPNAGEIAKLKVAGDPLATYLETMVSALDSRIYSFEAVDPSTISAAIPFATSAYLSYVPGIRTAAAPTTAASPGATPAGVPTPDELLTQNLRATADRYKLPTFPVARPINPPSGFEYGWEIEYSWTATKDDKSAQAQLAGLHYLLLRGPDAWILGFTTMLAAGKGALPVWRQIGGGLSAPALPPSPFLLAGLAGVVAAFTLLIALLLLIRRRRRRARALAALPRRRGHQRRR